MQEEKCSPALFHVRLAEALSRLGLSTQAEKAQKLGLSQGAVSRYLAGKYVPNSRTMAAIAERLGTTADWLYGRDSDVNVAMADAPAPAALDPALEGLCAALRDIPDEARRKFLEGITLATRALVGPVSYSVAAKPVSSPQVSPVAAAVVRRSLQKVRPSKSPDAKPEPPSLTPRPTPPLRQASTPSAIPPKSD